MSSLLDYDNPVARSFLLVDVDVSPGHLADGVDVGAAASNHTADGVRRHSHLLGTR